jgi:hypothetical protein
MGVTTLSLMVLETVFEVMRSEKEVVVVTTKRTTPKNVTEHKQTRVFETQDLAEQWIDSHESGLTPHQKHHTRHDIRSVGYFVE